MAGSTGANVCDSGFAMITVNSYKIYYETRNNRINSGIRLLDTRVNYGNDVGLMNAFRQLLSYDVNDQMLIQAKLWPMNDEHTIFYSKEFETLMLGIGIKEVNMFLIHYPALPNHQAKGGIHTNIHTESWLAVSQCHETSTRVNAMGAHNFQIKHFVHLTEVVAIGPMVHSMSWYSNYRYTYGTNINSYAALRENPLVKYLATQYQLSVSELLFVWALQRGETLIPRLNTSNFQMETVRLNVRLMEHDISRLDLAVLRVTSGEFLNLGMN